MAPTKLPVTERRDFRRRYRNLIYLAAERATLTVGAYDSEYQLCQVSFARKDGSIFVHFPYFPRKSGVISVVDFPEDVSDSVTLDLRRHGQRTSHIVKYSHHPDGRAHFSQDGRVRTEVRRQSFRLDGPIGNLFWLHAYEPFGLRALGKLRSDRVYLRSRFRGALPSAITVHAEWRRKEDVANSIHPRGMDSGPLSRVLSRTTGAESLVWFLGPPDGFPLQDHVLLIQAYATAPLKDVTEPTLIFLGGLDHHEVSGPGNVAKHTGALAFMYPSSGHGLSTVDFAGRPSN